MAGKPSIDGWIKNRDQGFLDSTIVLQLDIIHVAEQVMEISDDPRVVQGAVDIIRLAQAAQQLAIDYRPRLVELRRLARAGDAVGRE